MRALKVIHDSTTEALGQVHGHRKKTFWWCVESLLSAGRLVLTELGRHGSGAAYVKHKIKRVDRFAGNSSLHVEVLPFYQALAHWILRGIVRPVLLVDWTPSSRGFYALVASLPMGGRSVTIYAEVHPSKHLTNRRVEERFLQCLKTVLPSCCTPIIVTDAGFRTPWFDAVKNMGWEFIG